MKKSIAVVTTAGLLAVTWVSVSGAATASAASRPTAAAVAASRRAESRPEAGQRRTLARHATRTAIGAAADAIGITPAELLREIRAGKTVAQVAQGNDVAPDAVVDAVVNSITTKIDQAEANGKVRERIATRIKANLTERATRFVNETRHPGKDKAARARHPRVRTAITTSAETIGISPADLLAELRSGKTVAEVAQANDVEPKVVIDALTAAFSKRLDEAVANDKISEATATRIKARLSERAARFVNDTPHRDQRKPAAKPA